MTASVDDDLGAPLARTSPVRRVVSLVPSLTEAIASVDANALVGATDWCTHPPDLSVTRVRGTKNPDVRAILDLRPDVVIANKEENRELDVRRLREAGIPVWVTDIETLDGAFASLERMFDHALGWARPEWLSRASALWATPPASTPLRVVVPVWRDPWMVVGPNTFTADLLRQLNCVIVRLDQPGRYPTATVEDIDSAGADLILLPDEPYEFTAADGPEAFTETPTQLVSGRLLTWYGPSLIDARSELEDALRPWIRDPLASP